MADDDEMTDEMDEVEAPAEPAEEFDADEIAPEIDETELDDEAVFGEDDEEFGDDADVVEDDDDTDEDEKTETPLRRTSSEDDDDDDDLITPDDVEADLDTILKDRLVSEEAAAGEDEDDEPEDRSDPGDRLQPKRADEQLCSNCFLLVRNSAPACPVGADDDCPIFA